MGTWHFLLLVVACLHSTMAKYDFMKGDDSDRHSGGYPPHDFGNSRATYQRGGYDIYCPDGFREDGKGGCIDVDECTKGRIIRCGLNADCFNKKGSYVCLCRPGFKKNAHGHCVDINECDKYLDLCTDDENCLNVIGTYHCLCKAGYFKDAHGNCKKPGLKSEY
ncbi:uncharacterized protein LOC143277674 [Babylonia areolata]|uniref:uncharacterized protein LOC143277674 n=1 Tax=Babylonia areolata TaxID=304850 RepID=UPI003FD14B96